MSKSLNEWGRFLALVLRHKPQAVALSWMRMVGRRWRRCWLPLTG